MSPSQPAVQSASHAPTLEQQAIFPAMKPDQMPYQEWTNEPNQFDAIDPPTGYRYALRRGPCGHWCGYVQVPKEHPFYGSNYDNVPVKCHGGLTFASELPGQDGWWFGFDCAHPGDFLPMMPRTGDTYRNFAFVVQACVQLTHDLYKASK